MQIGNYKPILKNKNFMLLSVTSSFSKLGTRISYIAIMGKAFSLTGDPLSLGIVSILDLIPSIICGTFLAYLVDISSKRKMIGVCNLMGAVSSLVFAVTSNIYVLYLMVFIVGGIDELIYSAKSALEPQLIQDKKDLLCANSLKSFLSQTASILGPALGGIVIALWGYGTAFVMNAVSYLIPVIGVLFIQYREEIVKREKTKSGKEKEFLLANLEGIKYVYKNPRLRQIFIVNIIIQLIYGLQGPLLFPFVVEAFGIDSGFTGFLFSAAGIGGLLGSMAAVFIYKDNNIIRLFSRILLLDGCMFFIFTQSRIFVISVLLFTFAGAIGTIFETISNAAIQELADKQYMGRVFASMSLVSNPVNMCASGLGGSLAKVFTVTSIFSVSALGEILIAGRMMIRNRKK